MLTWLEFLADDNMYSSHHSAGMGKRLKSGNGGSREGSGGGDSVDSGYDEYDEDYRLVQLDFTLKN